MLSCGEKRSLAVLPLRRGLTLAILALVLAACNSELEEGMVAGDANARIEGSVIYRERMMLPPEAKIEVQFQDISQADAMASVLATAQLAPRSGPPYAFAIDYDPGRIDKRRRYALRASISVGDSLMFASTDYIDPFSGNPVEILVRRVAEPVKTSRESPGASRPSTGDAWHDEQ
jgi:putative lipoprotein